MKREIKKATISVEDASKMLGLHYLTTLKLAKDGRLPCVRLGRQFLILKEPFERMLKSPSRGAA